MNSYNATANLGADPEMRTLPDGKKVCNLRLAIRDRDNTIWLRATLWDRKAEIAAEYLQKGDRVSFTGALKQRTWEDSAGNKRTETEVTIFDFDLPPRSDSAGSSAAPSPRPPAAPAPAADAEIPF